MRSSTAAAFDFLVMALAVIISVVIPSTEAFLSPIRVGGAASTRRCPSHHLCQQRPVVLQRYCVNSNGALSMLSEENGAVTEAPDTEVSDLMEKAKAAQASIAPPSPPSLPAVVGPVMQPKEQKKKLEQDAAASSEPKSQWASGAFKRGLALQAIVLAFVIFLQFQPPEVAQLSICPPFVTQGCVSFFDWLLIVFTGAPIPPM